MSSSAYQRVTVEIENGNLAMVLATDTQYIGYKGLRQVSFYLWGFDEKYCNHTS